LISTFYAPSISAISPAVYKELINGEHSMIISSKVILFSSKNSFKYLPAKSAYLHPFLEIGGSLLYINYSFLIY
jgi:hypothetical protein